MSEKIVMQINNFRYSNTPVGYIKLIKKMFSNRITEVLKGTNIAKQPSLTIRFLNST